MATGFISEIFGSFQGEGPFIGERHIFVRFSGCYLGCEYCDTPYSLEEADLAYIEKGPGLPPVPVRNPLSVGTVVDAALAQEAFPGFNSKLAITGGEPLEQPEFLRGLLEALDGRFRVLLETNGVMGDALLRVADLVDIISMDFKLPSVTGKKELWDRHREFLDNALGGELIAKMVVSSKTKEEEVETAVNILKEKSPGALLVIQPVTPAGRFEAPGPETLSRFYTLAKRSLESVRVIPQVHKILGVR